MHSHTILKQWFRKVKWNANAMKFRHFYVWFTRPTTFGATVYVTVVNKSMSANRNFKNAWRNKIALKWNISRWSCFSQLCMFVGVTAPPAGTSANSLFSSLGNYCRGLACKRKHCLFSCCYVTWLDRKGSGNTFPNLRAWSITLQVHRLHSSCRQVHSCPSCWCHSRNASIYGLSFKAEHGTRQS